MAEEDLSLDEPTEGDEESTEGSGGNKKLIIIIAVLVTVILLGVGAAAYFLLAGDDVPNQSEVVTEVTEGEEGASSEGSVDESEQQAKSKLQPPPKGDVIYVTMPDPLLVNITSGKRTRMMQVRINFMVRSQEAEDALKLHMPLVRNNLLDFLSTADAEEVRTREGRNKLKDEAFDISQEVMMQQAGFEAIEMLLFTDFVVQ